jgi:hypothetical protein
LAIFIQALRDFNTPALIQQYEEELANHGGHSARVLSTTDESEESLQVHPSVDDSDLPAIDSPSDNLRSPSPYPVALSEPSVLFDSHSDDHHYPVATPLPASYFSFRKS